MLRRKRWATDAELREGRAASVGRRCVKALAGWGSAALSAWNDAVRRAWRSSRMGSGLAVVSGCWDTGAEYNMLDEGTALLWDGGRRRRLAIAGYDGSPSEGRGGDDLVGFCCNDGGQIVVQNFGPTYFVPGITGNLWAGVHARDSQGVGMSLPHTGEDALHTKEGQVLPLSKDPDGARVRHLHMVIAPTAMAGVVPNGTLLADVDWSSLPAGTKRRVEDALRGKKSSLRREAKRRGAAMAKPTQVAVVHVNSEALRRTLGERGDGRGGDSRHVAPKSHGEVGAGDDGPAPGESPREGRRVRMRTKHNTYAYVNVRSTDSPIVPLTSAEYFMWRSTWGPGRPRSDGGTRTRARLGPSPLGEKGSSSQRERSLARYKRALSRHDAEAARATAVAWASEVRAALQAEQFEVWASQGERVGAAAVARQVSALDSTLAGAARPAVTRSMRREAAERALVAPPVVEPPVAVGVRAEPSVSSGGGEAGVPAAVPPGDVSPPKTKKKKKKKKTVSAEGQPPSVEPSSSPGEAPKPSKKKTVTREKRRMEEKRAKKERRRVRVEAELEARRKRRRQREGLNGPPKSSVPDREERLQFMRLMHLISHQSATLLNARYDSGEFKGAGMRVKPEDLGCFGGCGSCGYSKTRKKRKKKKLPRRVPGQAFHEVGTDIYYIGRDAHRLNRKGYKYVLGFVCRSTGYTFRFYMKDKKVKTLLRGFRAFESKLEAIAPYVERELGYKPKLNTLCSDVEGGETSTWAYTRSEFDAEMVLRGVRRRFTGADNPEGNGKVEVGWKMMDQTASHNLAESGFTEEWYVDAVHHSTVHHNCQPTSMNKIGGGVAPALYLGLPEYRPEKLAPFGASAWIPVQRKKEKVDGGVEVHRGKRRRRGQACVLLGYGEDTEGYRVLDLHKLRVVTTPHAGVVPGLGGVRDLVTSIRADPSRVAKHAAWVWRLFRFEPRAKLKGERIRTKSGRILDWIDPDTLTPAFEEPGPIDGGLSPEASGGKEVEREGEAVAIEPKVRSPGAGTPPSQSEPLIKPNSNELVGADVNDQSRPALQPHRSEKQKKSKSGGKRRTSAEDAARKQAERSEKERVKRLIRYARDKEYRLEYDQGMSKQAGSMSDERYQQYKHCTTFEEVDQACVTPLVYSNSGAKNGKHDTVMRKGDLAFDLMHGYLSIVDEEGLVVSDAVAARAGTMALRPSALPVTFGMCTAKGVALARKARAADEAADAAGAAARAAQEEEAEEKWAVAVRRLVDEGVIEELYPNELRRLEAKALQEATEAWCKSVEAVESSRPSAISGCMPTWLAMAAKAQVRVEVDGMVEPISLRDALSMPEWPQWQKAVEKEVQALVAAGVWDEVPRSEVPAGRRPVPSHFILKIKTKESKVLDPLTGKPMRDPVSGLATGESRLVFVKCKGRLVYGGHRSVAGQDYHETAAFVASAKSVRTMLSLAASKGYKVIAWDISQAFTIASVEDDMELFMELPPLLGSDGSLNPLEYSGCGRGKCKTHVAKLKHMLYGAKDAPRKFAEIMIKFMDSIGAESIITDQMVFRWEWQGHEMNMCLHVDDLVATPSSDEIKEEFHRRLVAWFGADRVTGGDEVDAVLGMGISRDWEKQTITISQGGFARKFLKDFGVKVGAGRRVDAPLPSGCKLGKYEGEPAAETIEWFRKFSGCLQWMAISTRPDLSYSAGLLSRFASCPGPAHVEAAKHVLTYIAWHPDLGITYHGSDEVLMEGYDHRDRLIGSVDSDLGGCLDTEKSTSGHVVWMNGGAVAWKSKRQGTCSTSTTEAECKAAVVVSMEVAWMRDLCSELGCPQECVRVMEDNSGCVALVHGEKDTARSSHYRRAVAQVGGEVARGSMWLDDVEGIHNPADIFTKSVEPSAQFGYLRDVIMGINPILYLSQGVQELLATGHTDKGDKLLSQSAGQGHPLRVEASGPDGLPLS